MLRLPEGQADASRKFPNYGVLFDMSVNIVQGRNCTQFSADLSANVDRNLIFMPLLQDLTTQLLELSRPRAMQANACPEKMFQISQLMISSVCFIKTIPQKYSSHTVKCLFSSKSMIAMNSFQFV